MIYHELVITVRLNQDITVEYSYEAVSSFISKAMLGDEQLKKFHEQMGFKYYVTCSLYPIEQDKVYRKGRVYLFNLRSLDVSFILKMKQLVMLVNGSPMKAIAIELRNNDYRPISEIYNITPAVAIINNNCWRREDGLKLLAERIHSNAHKKYQSFYGEQLVTNENFIEYIEQKNVKPIRIRYKNTSLFGSKLVLGVKQDEASQRLAFTVMGAGILEKNGICCGYCRAK